MGRRLAASVCVVIGLWRGRPLSAKRGMVDCLMRDPMKGLWTGAARRGMREEQEKAVK